MRQFLIYSPTPFRLKPNKGTGLRQRGLWQITPEWTVASEFFIESFKLMNSSEAK